MNTFGTVKTIKKKWTQENFKPQKCMVLRYAWGVPEIWVTGGVLTKWPALVLKMLSNLKTSYQTVFFSSLGPWLPYNEPQKSVLSEVRSFQCVHCTLEEGKWVTDRFLTNSKDAIKSKNTWSEFLFLSRTLATRIQAPKKCIVRSQKLPRCALQC